MFNRFSSRRLATFISFIVGLMSGIALTSMITPHIAPWFQKLSYPRGSLYVIVKYKDAPEEEVSGSELSKLILLKAGGGLVERVDPKKSSHRWDNLEPGWYVVKAYINDMYAGKTNEIGIRSGEIRWQEIVTELARSKIQIKVVSPDGTTPIEGAIVEIASHQGTPWRSYPTDSDGETPEILIARTTEANEYYNIYVYQKKDSKRSLIESVEGFKIEHPRIKVIIGARLNIPESLETK